MRSTLLAVLGLCASVLWPVGSDADPFFATLRLDPFSLVSFGDQEIYALPEGSEIEFEFAAAEGKGSIGFTIEPRAALLEPIPLRYEDESLRFSLGRRASGLMKLGDDGRLVMEIDAYVVVTLEHPELAGEKRLPVHLTTESAEARSLSGDRVLPVSGGRISGKGVQLVGTATNAEDDYPRPGAPVYVVLSGSFDRLPDIR
jgi:hypothetical protein